VCLVVGSTVLAASGCGSGCSSSDATLRIIGNVKPDAACQYSVSPSAEMWEVGYLDVVFSRPYVAHLLVENLGADPVTVDGGWRNVWYEPSHATMISGHGTAARGDFLVEGSVSIPGGGRRIVPVDPLGDGRVLYIRDFQDMLAAGKSPASREEDSSIILVVEGDADGTRVASDQWQYGMTVSMGPLVTLPSPGAPEDSPDYAGVDCCRQVSGTTCEAGQNYNMGSCADCAACYPELCNRDSEGVPISPFACVPALPGCGS
jgi:hypothetical protein